MRNFPHTPMTIKARLGSKIDQVLLLMEKCLEDTQLSSDKRYKMASDYISLFLRMDNEKRKEEDHRETMKNKKLNNLKSEYIISELEEASGSDGYENQSNFSTKVVQ